MPCFLAARNIQSARHICRFHIRGHGKPTVYSPYYATLYNRLEHAYKLIGMISALTEVMDKRKDSRFPGVQRLGVREYIQQRPAAGREKMACLKN